MNKEFLLEAAWIREWAEYNHDLIKDVWGRDGKALLAQIAKYADIQDKEATTHQFDRFWSMYPPGKRKVDRKGCLRIWVREGLDDEVEAILSGLRKDKAHLDWTKSNGSFIPMPSVWLNQRRWDVEEATDSLFAGAR